MILLQNRTPQINKYWEICYNAALNFVIVVKASRSLLLHSSASKWHRAATLTPIWNCHRSPRTKCGLLRIWEEVPHCDLLELPLNPPTTSRIHGNGDRKRKFAEETETPPMSRHNNRMQVQANEAALTAEKRQVESCRAKISSNMHNGSIFVMSYIWHQRFLESTTKHKARDRYSKTTRKLSSNWLNKKQLDLR